MRHITTALTITLISGAVFAEQRNAGSHVHGLNHATIVLEGNRLQIAYEFPAEQLGEQGHEEHKHEEPGDKAHELSEKLETIESIFSMVRLPDNAQCKETEVTHSLTQVGGSDTENAGHSDALIQATLDCGAPENLMNLSFAPAFDRFDDLEKIEVEGVIGNKALSETLTATSSSLAL
ncbi:DUF2796 domain-containing protein [Litoricolaceae bacterium]|nr:DUF2796 domain-containing protein [Litorivicinaceae bacterium]